MLFKRNRNISVMGNATVPQTPKTPKTRTWHKPEGKYYNISATALDAEHTLIAGYTGCGKSTFLRSIVQAMLTKYSPAEAKMIIIDPKQTDLEKCADLPHCIRYADDLDKVNAALAYACELMTARHAERRSSGAEVYEGARLYVIIDELNPILTDKHDKTRSAMSRYYIEQLVSLGRSASVHVICATQNPNKSTIPANISDNCTCRFGLHCMTEIQSRQVILRKGCEMLPKHGEAFAIIDGVLDKYKLPYVTQDDIKPLLDYWKSPSAVTYGY